MLWRCTSSGVGLHGPCKIFAYLFALSIFLFNIHAHYSTILRTPPPCDKTLCSKGLAGIGVSVDSRIRAC